MDFRSLQFVMSFWSASYLGFAAKEGYMLLAERLRSPEEKQLIRDCLERHLKSSAIDPVELYARTSPPNSDAIVWTGAMRRLFTLVAKALEAREPVLLVGETGCGKTTICQALATLHGRKLHMINWYHFALSLSPFVLPS
jgi:midasin